jgi:hypothetical protein
VKCGTTNHHPPNARLVYLLGQALLTCAGANQHGPTPLRCVRCVVCVRFGRARCLRCVLWHTPKDGTSQVCRGRRGGVGRVVRIGPAASRGRARSATLCRVTHYTPMAPTLLWIGGSSALARTYFEEVHTTSRDFPRVIAAAPAPPSNWQLPSGAEFVALDLFSEDSVRTLWDRLPCKCDALVLGVRLSLVWAGTEQVKLTTHLKLLLTGAAKAGCRVILHISSVAVADHVVAQHNASEDDALPALDAYHSEYDRFKRLSEELVDQTCEEVSATAPPGARVWWSHLRISGIFSNDEACIQCSAVRNQALVSCYSHTCIDFNSSHNVAHAIVLLLSRMHQSATNDVASTAVLPQRTLYYYTRSTAEPVPYGQHVADYRAAHGIWYGVFFPGWVFNVFVAIVRIVCSLVPTNLSASIAYLLAVATADHTFNNARFRTEFSDIGTREETVRDAFARIARRQRVQKLK